MTAICTISSSNYFAQAKTLLHSIASLHPDCDLYYLLADEPSNEIPSEKWFSCVLLEELSIPNLQSMTFVYEITELNTAVKPFLLSFLLKKGYQKVIYLDPDILVYGRLDVALNALDANSIALTPHGLHPAPAPTSFLDKVQWEQNMTYTGMFNLGFIGISNTPETFEFLEWWKARCQYLCFLEPNLGIFVDQKWAELSLVFWKNVYIVRDPGYNVSIWNFHERVRDNRLLGERENLTFFHYSSIEIKNPDLISKHDKSLGFEHYPMLARLFAEYRKSVMENGYDRYSPIPYAFDHFANGQKIDLLERRLYAMVADQYPHDPFTDTRKAFYRNARNCASLVKMKPPNNIVGIASKGAYWLFRLLGPRRYRELMGFLGKTVHLRAHTFLLR